MNKIDEYKSAVNIVNNITISHANDKTTEPLNKADDIYRDYLSNMGKPAQVEGLKKKAMIAYTNETDKANDYSRELADFTINNLSSDAIKEIKHLYSNLGTLVDARRMNSEDLDYLMQATPDARCSFCKNYTVSRIDRLRKINEFRKLLLAAKQNKFPRLFEKEIGKHAINLEAIMTAMGYTALYNDSGNFDEPMGPSWVIKEGIPSFRLIHFIDSLKKHLVPQIEDENVYGFPIRNTEVSAKTEDWETISKEYVSTQNFSTLKDESITSDGIVSTHIAIPQGKQSPMPYSRKKSKPGLNERVFVSDSFVAKGIKQGVPMRAHASGSVALTLAAMQYVHCMSSAKCQEDEKDLLTRAGVLTATYESGDYHSFAETAAGVCHYHQNSKGEWIYKNETHEYLEDIDPKTYLGLGIGLLNRVVKDEKLDEFNEKSQKILDEVLSPKKGALEKSDACQELSQRDIVVVQPPKFGMAKLSPFELIKNNFGLFNSFVSLAILCVVFTLRRSSLQLGVRPAWLRRFIFAPHTQGIETPSLVRKRIVRKNKPSSTARSTSFS